MIKSSRSDWKENTNKMNLHHVPKKEKSRGGPSESCSTSRLNKNYRISFTGVEGQRMVISSQNRLVLLKEGVRSRTGNVKDNITSQVGMSRRDIPKNTFKM